MVAATLRYPHDDDDDAILSSHPSSIRINELVVALEDNDFVDSVGGLLLLFVVVVAAAA